MLDYRYNALRVGVKEQNTELTLNASGLRDTERVIKIAKETAIRELKKTLVPTNPYLLDNVSLAFDLGKLGNRGNAFHMRKKLSYSSKSLAKKGLQAPPFSCRPWAEMVNCSLSVTDNCTNYLFIYFFLDASTWFSTSEKVAKNKACLKMGLKICVTGCKCQGKRPFGRTLLITFMGAVAAPTP